MRKRGHPVGTRLGCSICTLEDLRGRCVIDADTGCWHLRKADGRPYQPHETQKVWMYGKGLRPALRGMWELHSGKEPRRGLVVYRAKCESFDCVNPAHCAIGTRSSKNRAPLSARHYASPQQLVKNRESGLRRSKVPAEIRQWILESPQNGVEIAAALDVTNSHVNEIRRTLRLRMWGAA